MELKEAISILKAWNKDLSMFKDEVVGIEVHNMAIEALEYREPMKPEYVSGDAICYYRCARCGEVLGKFICCIRCGQKIDWRNVK